MIWNFFTLWVMILIALAPWTQNYFDLVYLTWIVLFVGSFISFVYPREYNIGHHKVAGWRRFWIADVLIHGGMFVFICFAFWKRPELGTPFLHSCLLIATYLILFYREDIYGLDLFTMLSLCIAGTLVFSVAIR